MFLQQDMGTFVLVLCMHRVQPGHLESINDNKSTQRLCFIQLQNVTDFSNYRIRSSQNEILSDYERSLVILLAPLFSSSFILLPFCVEGLKSWGIGWLRDGRLIMCVFIQTGKCVYRASNLISDCFWREMVRQLIVVQMTFSIMCFQHILSCVTFNYVIYSLV